MTPDLDAIRKRIKQNYLGEMWNLRDCECPAMRADLLALLAEVERLQEALGRILELPALALDSEAGSRADDIVQEALKEDTP